LLNLVKFARQGAIRTSCERQPSQDVLIAPTWRSPQISKCVFLEALRSPNP